MNDANHGELISGTARLRTLRSVELPNSTGHSN